MHPRFTLSVLAHNNLALTQACLRSVALHSRDCEVIVTDNASTDGTGAYLTDFAAKNPRLVRTVINKQNAGFNEPNNYALTLARGEFFVTLNNDVEVCEGWLERLVEAFDTNPRLGLAGLAGTCCIVNDRLVGAPAMRGETPEYVEGSCMMVPTALARRVGLFSSYLRFAYWEDSDLSLRLREQGYEIAHVPLPMTHRNGSTTKLVPQVREHLAHNTDVMRQRWSFYWRRRDLKRRILVVRGGARGDVLLLTPALRALRDRYPLAEIDVQTKCPEMLAGLDWLGRVVKKRTYYDEVYDLIGSYEKRPEVHIVQAYADALGVTLPKRWRLEMQASAAEEAWAERMGRGAKLALVHPGPTCWTNKNWPVERFAEVAQALQARGYLTATVGAADAPEIATNLQLAGSTTPQQLYALAKRARLFVGIDSMPQHVVSAADTPSVVLFGPTNARCIVRPSHRIVTVQADQKLVPCVGEHGRRKKAITQAPCDGACMRAISVEMVLNAVERVERLTL